MKFRGYEVVCPDGCVRRYPYHNKGDAACDAEVMSGKLECSPSERWTTAYGKCPQGSHTVRPIRFENGPERLS